MGNIGSEAVLDYTVVGDVVNIGKRLQEEGRSCQILLSEDTRELVSLKGAELLEAVDLSGKSETVRVYLLEL